MLALGCDIICHTPGKKLNLNLNLNLNRSGLSSICQETLKLNLNLNCSGHSFRIPLSILVLASLRCCTRLCWGPALGLRLRWAALALGCAGKSCAGLALALGCAGAGLRWAALGNPALGCALRWAALALGCAGRSLRWSCAGAGLRWRWAALSRHSRDQD